MLKNLLALAALLIPLIIASGCDSFGDQISRESDTEGETKPDPQPEGEERDVDRVPPETVWEALSTSTQLTGFWDGMVASGVEAYVGAGNADLTVFAPSNEAISRLGESRWEALLADPGALENLLKYHMIEAVAWDAEALGSLSPDEPVEAANGDWLVFSQADTQLHVNTARIVGEKILAEDGVVQVIDQVLIPPEPVPDQSQLPSLAELIQGDERLGLFSRMVAQGGLLEVFEGEGPLTVFAMTDTGFLEVAGEGFMNSLNRADQDRARVMTSGFMVSGPASTSVQLYTLSGSALMTDNDNELQVQIHDGGLRVQAGDMSAKLIQPDVLARNGVLHIIGSFAED